MATSTYNRSTYHHYPFLTQEEFAEVCHYLDVRYCQAALGPLRKQWRLNLHTALDTSATSYVDQVTFLQITRPFDTEAEDQLTSLLGNVALEESMASTRRSTRQATTDRILIDMEDADKEVLSRRSSRPSRASVQSSHVVYEVHLHSTYRAPCLWFSLHNLPIDESPFDIDTVFRRLVPDRFKDALRGEAAIGGISIEHHPITGVPTFFVHPCFLGDAMARFDCSKEDYLMVWLGLVGGCVGLWVPKQMAMGQV